jgi:hypothetical protein
MNKLTYSEHSVADLARLAAFIDGEGSIIITRARFRGKDHNRRCAQNLVACVGNTDVRLMDWLKATFGGNLSCSPAPKKRGAKPYWLWRVTDAAAEHLLKEARSYFILKGGQADVGFAFRRTFIAGYNKRFRIPESVWQQRDQYREQLSALKHIKPEVQQVIQ